MNLKLKIPTSSYPFMWFLFDGMFLFVISSDLMRNVASLHWI